MDSKPNASSALVVDIGRTAIRIGLTDAADRLNRASIRIYDPSQDSSVTSVIAAFARDSGLKALPSRCAIAVSGVPRGEVMQLANGCLTLCRQELAEQLGAPALILNDFAASAWAMSSRACEGRLEAVCGAGARPGGRGTYCIIGVGSGLGVALMVRDEAGAVSVIPTEAGHMGYMAGLAEVESIAGIVGARRGHLSAEVLISRPGLVTIYQALANVRGVDVLCVPDLLSARASKNDPLSGEAHEHFVKALWHFAGNMVMAFGAWDGVILTGSVVAALKSVLRRPDLARAFVVGGPYGDRLRAVPRAIGSFEHVELEGAAVALRNHEARQCAPANVARIAALPEPRRARRNGRGHGPAASRVPAA